MTASNREASSPAPLVTPVPDSAASILERITDAFFALDTQMRFTYLNDQAERLLQRARAELLGKSIWDEFPEAVGGKSYGEYFRAANEQIAVSFDDYYAPLATWFENHIYPSPDGLSVYFRNINERKAADEAHQRQEQALHASEEHLREIQARLEVALTAGEIATWNWDIPNARIIADSHLAEMCGVSPEDAAAGRLEAYLEAIHPDDRPGVAQAIDASLTSGDQYTPEYRVLRSDGAYHWIAVRGKVERDASGKAAALAGIIVDTTEQVERRQRERFLADLAERARRLTNPDDVVADAVRSVGQFLGVSRCLFADIDIQADTCTIPFDYCADESVASIVGVFSIASFGPFVVAEYQAGRSVVVDDVRADALRVPSENVAAYDAINIRAHVTVPVVHSDRLVSCISCHSATPRHWTLEDVELLQTVVERTWLTVEVTRQQRALMRESEERREAHARMVRVLESITDGFYVIDRAWRFSYVNAQAERMLHRTREELLGRVIWEAFPEAVGGTFYDLYRRAMDDGNVTTFEDYYAPLDSWMDVRVYPSEDGLSVFFQNVNARKAAEEERERLLAIQQARTEREALINRIGFSLRSASDPDQILETALRELGVALKADRCYYAAYEQDIDTATVGPEWHREGLAAMAGKYAMSPYAVNRDPNYQSGKTQIVPDLCDDPAALALGLRALARVPLVTGVSMTTLTVAMTTGPRAWTTDEVELVESVASLTRSSVEAARVRLWEQRIAAQLQEALQPGLPGAVPGLAVSKYYEAALAEAGVGGDFYDVFALEKGCTALVVGDLSGKGLAAAAQVATVRNMLRAFVYTRATLAGAVTELNQVLAENGLLAGFTTLFIGVYDAGERALTYVNCGQEPALVKRAAGSIEMLRPTGTVLGSFEGATFEERVARLGPGDALAVFTDGFTEAGPSRAKMLGVEGVSDLLATAQLPETARAADAAQYLALALIAGVNAVTQGGVVRDDMCLLLAVAE